MQQAIVKGRVTSVVKHESLARWRLLICQPLGVSDQPSGDPLLAVDQLGAGSGDRVLISSDGRGMREMLQNGNSPARWWTIGIVDE
ncbi:MAG: EutN/CcmL family microcompartment protein [Phycisphaeraceae bacterium]|nr:EutN/CcmL family microcompartment protein [Phycisphaeraceae bacterium]MDP7347871.1 EutN/CcmL family microcompartment protein [Phycisphaeraceae bacterium]